LKINSQGGKLMSLNTRIRGLQIKDADVGTTQLTDDGVTNAKLANITRGSVKVGGTADAPTDLVAKTDGYILIGDGTDIASVAVSGDVTIANTGAVTISANAVEDSMVNDNVATGLAGVGLSASGGVMALDLNEVPTEATFDATADFIGIVDATDNGSNKTLWSVIATAIAGSGLTATNGVLSADAVSDNLIEADVLLEDESANTNGSSVAFTLSSTPITNSVQVFLNGLLQQVGSGKDYTLAGTTVTFATAPASDDILLIHYLRND